jgi:hypothetical protein
MLCQSIKLVHLFSTTCFSADVVFGIHVDIAAQERWDFLR